MFDNHWQPWAWKPPAKWAIRWKITGNRHYAGYKEGWVYRYVWFNQGAEKILAQNATDKLPMTLYDTFEAALADVLLWTKEAEESGPNDSFFTIVNTATGETIPGEIFS